MYNLNIRLTAVLPEGSAPCDRAQLQPRPHVAVLHGVAAVNRVAACTGAVTAAIYNRKEKKECLSLEEVGCWRRRRLGGGGAAPRSAWFAYSRHTDWSGDGKNVS